MSEDLWDEIVNVADDMAEAAAEYAGKESGKHKPEARVGYWFKYLVKVRKIADAHPRLFKDP